MTFLEYVQSKKDVKPNQEIIHRWVSRIVHRGLQHEGRAGAVQYLNDYGQGIKAPKVVMLARQADLMGYGDMAAGFWAEAYRLETGQTVEGAELPGSADAPVEKVGLLPELHESMQPGAFVTMQPVDGKYPRSYYINDDRYWAMPKREGEKMIIFATPTGRFYQTRFMRLRAAPSNHFDSIIADMVQRWGSFVLEGELYYLDVNGMEHQDGARAALANIELGQPTAKPGMRFSAFSCLFNQNEGDLRSEVQGRRVELAAWYMRKLELRAPDMFVEMPVARSREEKEALCNLQQAEGREGEIFFYADIDYIPEKKAGERFVRCKYLTEPMTLLITKVYKSTRPEQTISGFDVSTINQDGTPGKALGKIGTGYTHQQQKEILEAHISNPGKIRVVCVSRGFTVKGKLREGRFRELLTDQVDQVQEAPEGQE